jgi:riboflavin kinase/FMN adenylyltransferase
MKVRTRGKTTGEAIMKVIHYENEISSVAKGCVLTIGNFDGVHMGHQQIIEIAKKAAASNNVELVAMTFCPHPVAVLYPEKSPGVLTPIELKTSLLQRYGVDCLIILKSTVELLSLSAEDFVDLLVVGAVEPTLLVEGHDFNFGSGRSGNVERLQQLGSEKGFEVTVVEPVKTILPDGQNVRVSSTMIRKLLETGDVKAVNTALARPYRLIGKVEAGRGKGKQIGFPTANLDSPSQIIPADGVYAGFVEVGDDCESVAGSNQRIPAALSLGRAATFETDLPQLLEAHLLSENVPDLVGKWLAMDFVERLRGQIKFDNEEKLAEQIAKDCEKARCCLAE